jgi:hypothetical protein
MQTAEQHLTPTQAARRNEVRRILWNLDDRGFAPEWIAHKLGVGPEAVEAWRQGDAVPTVGRMARLRRLVRSARYD